MFEEQSGQNVLLFLPLKVLNSMLFQGDKEHEGMLGEGHFYKEMGIHEYNKEFREHIANNLLHIHHQIHGLHGHIEK